MMAQQNEIQTFTASSGMATGNRNRTSGLSLLQPSEDAAFSGKPGIRAASRLAIAIGAAFLLAGWAQAQVSVTPETTPAVGPGGPFYPKVGVCNQTNLPVNVEGYRFRTQNYAGYTTWMPGLTHTGTSPVEYTQSIPESERQMQAGQCRAAATDYTSGVLTAGQIATLTDGQALIKTGSCAEVPKYTDAEAHSCTGFDAIRADAKYVDNRCLVDTIGTNGGDSYGGFVSTFAGQTQLQVAIPSNTFVISNTNVRWDPYAYGPQYMMALAGAQEMFNVDMQFLAAVSGKETFMGMVRAESGARLDIVPVQDGVHGYWQVESATFNTWVKSYPQFFPKYGACISRYPDVTAAFPTCGGFEDPGAFYLRPTPTSQMGPNSPQLINGAVVTSLGFYTLYDALALSTDLCFLDIIKNSVDPRVSLAVMLPGYNQGRYSGFETPLKSQAATIRTAPNASTFFSDGVSNYRSNIFNVLDQLVNAGKNCGAGRRVYDTSISLNEVQRFVFGGSNAAGTPAVQGDGGLLLHYDLTVAQRQDLWDDVTCAFDKLKGKAPSMAGKAEFISYRYDFLTLLRVVKKHLPVHVKDRRVPVEHDFNALVKRNSAGNTVCGTNKPKDATYPSLTLTSPKPGDQVDQIKTPGLTFTFKATDNAGPVAKAEWTMDKNWGVWKPARKAGTDTYEFDVTCETPGWPKAGQGGKLWVSTTDDCGNTTVQELPFTVKAGTYCGDAPPMDPPVANPPGGGFFDSVMVTLEVPGVTGAVIHYTVDGSKPTAASAVYAGPIRISGTANVTLRAFATKPGLTPSPEASWLFTKETRPLTQTPVADPTGRTFLDTDPDFTVTLTSESGAVIHFTTDGTPATLTSPVYAGPITVGTSMTLNAIAIKEGKAPSQPMKPAVFLENKSPIMALKGSVFDENGDGKIEKATVVFAKTLPNAPAKLSITLVAEDNQTHMRAATAGEITLDPADPKQVIIGFANPFPFGVTSFKAGSMGKTHADAAIPLIDAEFPLEDKAAPVIIKAVVTEGDSAQPMKHIAITYSEPMKGPASSQTAWIFKRAGDEMASADVRIGLIQGENDRLVNVFIDTASARFPIRGDSVAISLTSEITDNFGLAPKVKFFRLLEGEPAASKPVRFSILFPNGTTDKPSRGSSSTLASDAVFIPLGLDGNALPGGRELGRCPGCAAKDGDTWVGPVFKILTPGPLSYTFKIFNNVGEFVTEGKGEIEEKEMDLLKKDRAGVNYELSVVWTGNTTKGRKAGTGAYVVLAIFNLKKDMRTGAGPSKHTDKKVFGLIRNL